MSGTRVNIVIAAVLVVVGASTVLAADPGWPGWRGPTRDGRSDEKNLLDQWPEGGPKVVWKTDFSVGMSSPVVVGEDVFVVGCEQNKAVLASFDRKTGEKRWTVPFAFEGEVKVAPDKPDERYRIQGPFATPTVDGDRVYVMSKSGEMACVSTTTKEVLWKQDLKKMGGKTAGWGASSSFLIRGDAAIVNMAAFNKVTGELLWKGAETLIIDHSSPVAVTVDGQEQVIMHAKGGLVSVDAATGRENWFWKAEEKDPSWNVIFTPVWTGKVLVARGRTKKYAAPAVLVKVGKEAGVAGYQVGTPLEAFVEPTNQCQCSSPVVEGDFLFGVTTNNPKSELVCVSLETGKVAWRRKEIPDHCWASLLVADGKVFLMQPDGVLVMFKATGESYQEMARAKVSERTEASPALAGGCLFLRDEAAVLCLKVSKQ